MIIVYDNAGSVREGEEFPRPSTQIPDIFFDLIDSGSPIRLGVGRKGFWRVLILQRNGNAIARTGLPRRGGILGINRRAPLLVRASEPIRPTREQRRPALR